MFFHELVATLDQFWLEQGCVIAPPQDTEAGAGTFYPTTFLRVLGSEPWRVAGIAPSRRPQDGRYGQNPYRFQHFYQYQVVLKPSPSDVQDTYLRSLEAIGIDPEKHDIRFVEDNWESPTLGAWGLGWEVWLDGMEITQFTYFQQVGGFDCKPVSVELTYGLERLALYMQGKAHTWDLELAPGVNMGDLRGQSELEHSRYNFEESNPDLQRMLFDRFAEEAERLFAKNLVYPGYEFVIKCSHAFNLLDARGVLSHAERQAYVQRVRRLAAAAAKTQLGILGELPADAEAKK